MGKKVVEGKGRFVFEAWTSKGHGRHNWSIHFYHRVFLEAGFLTQSCAVQCPPGWCICKETTLQKNSFLEFPWCCR